jgi:hypothetical protein
VYSISTFSATHQVIGWALLVLSFTNIYYGWDIFHDRTDEDNTWMAPTAYILYLILFGLLELNHRVLSRITTHWLAEYRLPTLPTMTHKEVMDAIFR